MKTLEATGWSRIDISPETLDRVGAGLSERGWPVEDFFLAGRLEAFQSFRRHPLYASDYRLYNGDVVSGDVEKMLEHFVSFELFPPQFGMTAIDIGSCRSIVPQLLLEEYAVLCLAQDLDFPAGVHGNRVGSNADSIPLEAGSIDFMTLHCTFEHFEGQADTGFVREAARLLKPGGMVVIAPLYLNCNHVNITGSPDPSEQERIGFDADASYHCLIPEWQNRFGRHYSPAALETRVLQPARAAGLEPRLHRVRDHAAVQAGLWLNWALTLQKPAR